ncbi:MAG: nicotinate-nucleotide adenylyltransferase [Candidatus Symbiothrix sp.]|jgi:nicotinate-nucleotide adenylyltransferase|nr:nicotinate-nucleotide adenylyltransferase [Candidatus Symbiothrix sp.]
MKIGLFPGSFSPIHVGHLAIANHLAEYEGYEQIWFLISPQNPLKKKNNLLDQNFRLELLKEAVGDYDKFVVSTLEWDMPQPSYTINTLQKLRVLYPNDTFELIIGSDNWATFHRWKDYQLILKNFKVLIYPRRGSDRITIFHPNVSLCRTAPKIEMSSTAIRKAIATGKDLRFYMPTGMFQRLADSGLIPLEPEEIPALTGEPAVNIVMPDLNITE